MSLLWSANSALPKVYDDCTHETSANETYFVSSAVAAWNFNSASDPLTCISNFPSFISKLCAASSALKYADSCSDAAGSHIIRVDASGPSLSGSPVISAVPVDRLQEPLLEACPPSRKKSVARECSIAGLPPISSSAHCVPTRLMVFVAPLVVPAFCPQHIHKIKYMPQSRQQKLPAAQPIASSRDLRWCCSAYAGNARVPRDTN